MSRIFEALQRSEAERAGFAFPEPPSVAADRLATLEEEKAKAKAQAQVGTEEPVEVPPPLRIQPQPHVQPQQPHAQPRIHPQAVAPVAVAPKSKEIHELGEFPTVQVSLALASRLVSLTDKDGLGAEQFRFLGVRLRQLQQTRRLKKLLITSTLPGEGKSLVSANLASTLARRRQQKVLLLEGDLRRPVQSALFGGGHLPGLSEWLQAGLPAVNNIYFLDGPGFWLMPAGTPPENPLELMQSGKLSTLLDQLSEWFDWVVIDSPPVLPLADTSVWSRVADGILMVVRQGKSEKRQVKRGLEVIDASRLLGVVINSCTNTVHQDYYARYSPAAGQSSIAKPEGPSQAGT
jgi:capsular exopolysaccharide synthesis family protein